MFSRKTKVITHPKLLLNNNSVYESSTKKHLGMFSDKTSGIF